MTATTLQARVHQMRHEADGILSLELRPLPAQAPWPGFEAGAHIDLHLAPGLVRSYSLLHPSPAPAAYTVAVLKDPKSRGGSRAVHEQLRIGQVIEISPPRNHFPLAQDDAPNVLVAGGIGITPLYAMVQTLLTSGRQAELIYCARSRAQAAFLAELEALVQAQPGLLRLTLRFDDEQGSPPDLQALLGGRPAATHFYACGPGPMLDAFERACAALAYPNVHLERFTAKADIKPAAAGGYRVTLQRSGKQLEVAAGTSLLDALEQAGADVSYSCREGVCGSCETRVLCGEVDHRDSILTPAEQVANKSMMVCVSGCRSGELVLDL